jgi:hypothetical protein
VCKSHLLAAQLLDSVPLTLEQQLLGQRKLLQEAGVLVDELAERVRVSRDGFTSPWFLCPSTNAAMVSASLLLKLVLLVDVIRVGPLHP